ncbi:UvrD-helicase domain-containing protein [Endozoicomonas sp. 2B-B]
MKHYNQTLFERLLSTFFDRYTYITSNSESLEAKTRSGENVSFHYRELVDFPEVTRSFFCLKINMKMRNKNESLRISRFSPLYHDDNGSIFEYQFVIDHFNKRIESKKNEFIILAVKEYLRDSSIEPLSNSVFSLIKAFTRAKASWLKYISEDNAQWLLKHESSFPLDDDVVAKLREKFEKDKLRDRKSFYDRIESNPLTPEQRLAVVRENDRNMVLAAAGTGKTSVMVAKALDLIDGGQYKASDILVLAYNNAAAKELRERIAVRAKEARLDLAEEPQISTFHSLGRKILRDSGVQTHISFFAEDTRKFDKWVYDWLVNYISSSTDAMKNFIAIHYRPSNPFKFKSKEEYERFVRDNEYRALSTDLVRGYQELLIANWLYLNGIKFEYEAHYVTKVRVDIGHDYRPDFHISDTNIYIEHFGIDRLGKTRPDIDASAYRKSMDNKRELHKRYGTRLIETFHYDWVENCLEESLKKQISELGVKINPISDEEVLKALNESGIIDKGAKVLQKSLQAIRVEQLDSQQILERLNSSKVHNSEKHAEILSSLHDDYVKELKDSGTIDFDDMIIRASNCIREKKFKPSWKFILVDEFQDISGARMSFLNNLIEKGDNPKLTVVGDDWQSIYRFSGGKLELTTRFSELVGSKTKTMLQKTFRYNNSIADTAGTFIMENDEQYKKHIETHTVVSNSQIYLLDSKVNKDLISMALKALQIVKKIRQEDRSGSVAILSRYRYLIKDAKEQISKARLSENVKFWTFHGSKGLEADYCILIGFAQGKTGFPNENKDDEVVEALLPSLDDYPHSEERRLMYVALTRAKKKSYIIADPTAPSSFINELISPKYDLHIVSETFKESYRKIFKCPNCTEGYFKKIDGKFGAFLKCSSEQACLIKPRVCKSCGAPSIDNAHSSVCQNPNCGESFKICPRCARPMALRDGKFSKFYGCTGYGIKEDQCKYTERI